jgi:hypothetical protein
MFTEKVIRKTELQKIIKKEIAHLFDLSIIIAYLYISAIDNRI